MSLLNLARIEPCTRAEGPGKRFALWVQGCLLRCFGCCNPELFEFEPRKIISAETVFEKIHLAREEFGIEGVTFLGGEPFLQAKGLGELARKCRQEGFTVMTFTGFLLRDLKTGRVRHAEDLVKHSDILIDGPFLQDQPDHLRHWAGSTNQQFHYLSSAYPPGTEYDPSFAEQVDIRVLSDGEILFNGLPMKIGH